MRVIKELLEKKSGEMEIWSAAFTNSSTLTCKKVVSPGF